MPAQDCCMDADHRAQLRGSRVSPSLLDEAQHHTDDHHKHI